MLISLIIPVYNAEKYIEDCLDSVVSQLQSDTEVVIIDDCSKDKSLTLINNYTANLDKEIKQLIKVISLKENRGVGFARKHAIDNAVGKYICSVDPDDVISQDYFKTISKLLKKFNPDIMQFQISRFYHKVSDKHIMSHELFNEGMYNIDSNIRRKIYEQNFWSFCTSVILKSLFENIDISSLRNCEDVYALPLIILKAKTIYVLNKDLYYYRLNHNSLSKHESNIENTIISYKYILEKYTSILLENEILYFAIIPILRGYLTFILHNKSYRFASSEWSSYKGKLKINLSKRKRFDKISHNLFAFLGMKFLYLSKLIGK